jgi:hypothetical protein
MFETYSFEKPITLSWIAEVFLILLSSFRVVFLERFCRFELLLQDEDLGICRSLSESLMISLMASRICELWVSRSCELSAADMPLFSEC